MEKVYFLVFFAFFSISSFSQTTCSGGRYYDDVFSSVTMYSGIPYGQNTNVGGAMQTLKLDFYKPTGDTDKHRPVIIFAFGGSFVFGWRNSPDIVQLCNGLAKKGYVCISIDYRLGLSPTGLDITSDNVKKAIWRVAHDMRAAVRWCRMNASVDSLGMDTSKIIVGGVSAGGFGALHCAYLDKDSEIPAVMDTINEGGVEGYSGNPGYSSRPLAVVNLCGALIDTNWIEPGDVPVLSFHGSLDGTVPYCTNEIEALGTPITGLVVHGSNPVQRRAWNLGIHSGFYTYWGAEHTPFVLLPNSQSYMDTTIRYIRDFLSGMVCGTPFSYVRDSLTEAYCASLTSSVGEIADEQFYIYPNPVSDKLIVELPSDWLACNSVCFVEVFDVTGRKVLSQASELTPGLFIDVSNLKSGTYFLKIMGGKEIRTTELVILK